jgi:hypothetical protein
LEELYYPKKQPISDEQIKEAITVIGGLGAYIKKRIDGFGMGTIL